MDQPYYGHVPDTPDAPQSAEADVPGRYRVDELARLAATTVRNVRAYQDRGLLPPPQRVGRVGWYSDAHLARLRLIGELLSRGYTLANIGELIEGWIGGRDITEVLGLEAALIAPWGERESELLTRAELEHLFGSDAGLVEEALQRGLLSSDAEGRYRIDRRLLEAAAILVQAGVPAGTLIELGSEIRIAADGIARRYVETISNHVVGDAAAPRAPEDLRRLADLVNRLRPLATGVVAAALSEALERRIGAEVGVHLARSIDSGSAVG